MPAAHIAAAAARRDRWPDRTEPAASRASRCGPDIRGCSEARDRRVVLRRRLAVRTCCGAAGIAAARIVMRRGLRSVLRRRLAVMLRCADRSDTAASGSLRYDGARIVVVARARSSGAGCAGARGSRPYSANGSFRPISRANSASGSFAGVAGAGPRAKRIVRSITRVVVVRHLISGSGMARRPPLAVSGIGPESTTQVQQLRATASRLALPPLEALALRPER